MTRRRPLETPLAKPALREIRNERLRAEAAAALAAQGETRVETIVFGATDRAAQAAGESVLRGEWKEGRLVTDEGGHLLDPDGLCFCRSCEMAGGYCVDDDE